MNYGMQLFSHDAHNQLVMLQTKNVDGKKFVWFDYLELIWRQHIYYKYHANRIIDGGIIN